MEYNVIKNADRIIKNSTYVVSNPTHYKNKWSDLFDNKNPINLELGTGRGDFIINMAKTFPKINFIGLELNESQLSSAVSKLKENIFPNLKFICADAKEITSFFLAKRLIQYI